MTTRRMTMRASLGLAVALSVPGGTAALASGDAAGGTSATTAVIAQREPLEPHFGSSHGITVLGAQAVAGLERTWQIDIKTSAISAYAHHGQLSVRVTLPRGYKPQAAQRYPVLYLLHGQGGRSSDWTDTVQGDAERITADHPVIVVTPEGGKASWYTDWVNQSGGAQAWETFHIRQLIPFIDANLKTKASGQHRAIAGISMGGFGALHYATRHPDLFNHVTAMSGTSDLEDSGTRTAVVGSAMINNLKPIDGSFGPSILGLRNAWYTHNPYRHLGQLRGMGIALYAGGGVDLIEGLSRLGTIRTDARLDRLGIPHYTYLYGVPGTVGDYTCDGTHVGLLEHGLGRCHAADHAADRLGCSLRLDEGTRNGAAPM